MIMRITCVRRLNPLFVFAPALFVCLIISCTRTPPVNPPVIKDPSGDTTTVIWSGALPSALLQTGEYPLWFQLTENGPLHIESIDYLYFSPAFAPWPYALYIRFLHERTEGLVMTINRDGFLKIAPNNEAASGLALYHFPGGEFWRYYTVGGFIFNNNEPAAVLYMDSRFINTDIQQPRLRTWSFNMNSNTPFPVQIPALERFPAEEDWSVDTLHLGNDGLMYYRAARRSGTSPSVRMFRTASLLQAGEEISITVFINSFSRQTDVFDPSLPPLPKGFVYTSMGTVGDSLFVSWEEQEDFSIGAAGFVVLKR